MTDWEPVETPFGASREPVGTVGDRRHVDICSLTIHATACTFLSSQKGGMYIEPKDKLLPCQKALLSTREDVNGWRIYRCESTRLACVISGVEPDEEMLALACKGLKCEKTPP